jgi:SSS family solute:Na+ symporter
MSNSAVALGIIALVVVGTMVFGSLMTRSVKATPTDFALGGRSFGTLFLWFLLGGEIYTTFTFLGAAGWAYGKGAPAFYILAYGTCAYVLSYFLLPPIWRYAKEHGLITNADFFAKRYDSKLLGALVALVGFTFLVPYVTLQLSGIQRLLTIAGYGAFDAKVGVSIAFIVVALYVFLNGLRGTAWGSVVKDVLVLAGVVFAGIVLPMHFFGSPAAVIDHVLHAKPTWMTLQGSDTNSPLWFVSTVVLTACGYYMWPHSIAATYSAKSDETLKQNAVFLPAYQIMLLLVFFAGWTALLVMPQLDAKQADSSFMLVVAKYYPAWVVGLIAAAGTLAGLIPASAQMLAAASVVSRNVVVELGYAKTDAQQTLVTRILVLVVAVLALVFWLFYNATLVGLLLIAYNGITQLFPGIVYTLTGVRANAAAIAAGIIVGIGVLAVCAYENVSTLAGMNAGLVALAANAAVAFLVGRFAPRPAVEKQAAFAK